MPPISSKDLSIVKEYIEYLNTFSYITTHNPKRLVEKQRKLGVSDIHLEQIENLSHKHYLNFQKNSNSEESYVKATQEIERAIQLTPLDFNLRLDYLVFLKKVHQHYPIKKTTKKMSLQYAMLINEKQAKLPVNKPLLKEMKWYLRAHRGKKQTLLYLWYIIITLVLLTGGNLLFEYYRNKNAERITKKYQEAFEEKITPETKDEVIIQDNFPVDTSHERWGEFTSFIVQHSSLVSHNQNTTYELKGTVTSSKTMTSGALNVIAMGLHNDTYQGDKIDLLAGGENVPPGVDIPINYSLNILYSEELPSSIELIPQQLLFSDEDIVVDELPLIGQVPSKYTDSLEFRRYKEHVYTGFDKRYYIYTFIIKNNSRNSISELEIEANISNLDNVQISSPSQIVYEQGPKMYSQQKWLQTLIVSSKVSQPILDQLAIRPVSVISSSDGNEIP